MCVRSADMIRECAHYINSALASAEDQVEELQEYSDEEEETN